MNLSPFDTNMKCSSKYMSPITIDMKTNTDIYQCTNTSYLKFNYKNSVLNYSGVTYFNSNNPYFLNLYLPDNSILYKNEIYTLLYISFNLPGTHKMKYPKRQADNPWAKTSNELAILDDSRYESPTYDLEINFVHYNAVNKKLVVLSSQCVSDKQFIDDIDKDKINRLWSSVEDRTNIEKYIGAYTCSMNANDPNYLNQKNNNNSTDLKSYCNTRTNIPSPDVLDATNPNNFRSYVVLEYLNKELISNITADNYYGLNIKFNPYDLLPVRKHHFIYSGSWQQNVQCYDNVVRIVFPEKMYVSKSLISSFEKILNNVDSTTYGNHPYYNKEYEIYGRKILKNLNYSYSNMDYTEKIANVKCSLKPKNSTPAIDNTCGQTVDTQNLSDMVIARLRKTMITLSLIFYIVCISIVIIRFALTKFGGPAYIPKFP